MDAVTQQALLNAHGKLVKAYAEISFALGQAQIAKAAGGPDFTPKLETLRETTHNLSANIFETVPEIEPHDGVGRLARGELTPKEAHSIAETAGTCSGDYGHCVVHGYH